MREDATRRLHTRSHEHRRPDHTVEPDDVLADEVHVGGPVPVEAGRLGRVVTAVAERGDVVQQRVDPDVGDVFLRRRDRNAPRERRARDGQVPQAALDERVTSLRRVYGLHEPGMLLVELEQPVLELRQLEEPVVLLDELDLATALGAHAIGELVLGPVRLVRNAIPPS